MKNIYRIALFYMLLIVLVGCNGASDKDAAESFEGLDEIPEQESPPADSQDDTSTEDSEPDDVSIASQESIETENEREEEKRFLFGAFNLYNFGPKRLEKPEAMDTTVAIARRFDFLILQELSNKDGDAISELLAQINAAGKTQYELLLSQRSGRSAQKEQYGFLYKSDRISILDFYDYDDGIEPDQDLFEREPAVAYIDIAGETLSIITLHADPDAVALELNRLIPVYEDAVASFGDPDAIIIGDLNADCTYLTQRDYPFVKLFSDTRFQWLIDDTADTTVRESTHCAYDRIISTRSVAHLIDATSASVYDFQKKFELSEDEALLVSDHFPVEVLLRVPNH